MTEKVIKFTEPQLIMLRNAILSYEYDLQNLFDQGGDKKQQKTLDALKEKLYD